MSRPYTFNQLVRFSGLSRNEAKHLIQKGVIRPDEKGSRGTGDHRAFGFFDVFEAAVVRNLYALPGGMPLAHVSLALERLRFDTHPVFDTAWSAFLDPQTRKPHARFWLCWSPTRTPTHAGVVNDDQREALLNDNHVVVLIRLDSLLLELEQQTGDHTNAEQRASAFAKELAAGDEPATDRDQPDAIPPRATFVPRATRIAAKGKE